MDRYIFRVAPSVRDDWERAHVIAKRVGLCVRQTFSSLLDLEKVGIVEHRAEKEIVKDGSEKFVYYWRLKRNDAEGETRGS